MADSPKTNAANAFVRHFDLNDPQQLIQLLCAQSPGVPEATADSSCNGLPRENPGPELGEEDVARAIQWLLQLNGTAEASKAGSAREAVEIPLSAKNALLLALAGAAERHADQPAHPLLLQIAEQLAVRVALEKYGRGESAFSAVQQTIDSLKKQILDLRQAVLRRGATMSQAVPRLEACDEELDRQFWIAVPALGKLQILSSPEAWCVPPANIRSFADELLARGDFATVRQILKNYCHQLGSVAEGATSKVASGLAELAELYAVADVLQPALDWLIEALQTTPSLEQRELLAEAFVLLERQAEDHHDFGAVRRGLLNLDRLAQYASSSARDICARLQLANRVPELVDHALRDPEPELLEVLGRVPQATAEQIAARFDRSVTRDEGERVRQLAAKLGTVVREHCCNCLVNGSDASALGALRILTALDGKAVEDGLPPRLRRWSPVDQAIAVQHISASGASYRGDLLLKLLSMLHPLVRPQAIDELGLAGCSESGPLLEIACGEGMGREAPYTQLKAIEAIGRLRLQAAIAELSHLVTAAGFFGAQYPREIRIAALQALLRIDPRVGMTLSAKSGISERELWLTPLNAADENWVRHRRYPRIAVRRGLKAAVVVRDGAFTLDMEQMSLNGGIGRAEFRNRNPFEAALEIRTGLRRVRFQALISEQRPRRLAFEIASIGLEDRSRLRNLLTAHSVTSV